MNSPKPVSGILLRVSVLLFLALVLCRIPVLNAGPVIDSKSIISDIVIKNNGVDEIYVLFRNVLNPQQWYAANLRPRLVEKTLDGKPFPDFTLLKYQRKDPDNPSVLIQGANLVFSLNIGPSDEVLKKLRSSLPPASNSTAIRISAIPLEGIQLFLSGPRGNISAVASAGVGLGSKFASQDVTFTVPLTALDADVAEALLTGETGVMYALKYNYQILGIPQPVKEETVQMSARKRARLERRSRNALAQLLNAENGLAAFRPPVRRRTPPTRTEREQQKKLQKTRVDLIRAEAHAQASQLLGKQRTGLTTAAEGFLSVKHYPESVRERLVLVEDDPVGWRNAYLAMPFVGDIPGVKIDEIELEVALRHKRSDYYKKKYFWKPEQGWRDDRDLPVLFGQFSLDTLLADDPQALGEAVFHISRRIKSNDTDLIEGVETIPVLAGDIPVTNPSELADVLEFDFSYLPWYVPDPDPDAPPPEFEPGETVPVARIDVVLQEDKRRFVRIYKPKIVDEAPVIPEQAYWLVSRVNPDEKPQTVKAAVYFHLANGRKVSWKLNDKGLRELFPTLYIPFYDMDIKP